MPEALVALSWRQYRLERRMFWRNPSAAFFNFVLPLLFLAGGRRDPAAATSTTSTGSCRRSRG